LSKTSLKTVFSVSEPDAFESSTLKWKPHLGWGSCLRLEERGFMVCWNRACDRLIGERKEKTAWNKNSFVCNHTRYPPRLGWFFQPLPPSPFAAVLRHKIYYSRSIKTLFIKQQENSKKRKQTSRVSL
jgi:hypothetical protein